MAPKPRQSISGPRQTGTIKDWKDKFGWIEPSKPINHPLASKRQGKIFLSIEDVVEELDGIGATVSFTLYSDATGLGAADVKMAKAPMPASTPAKGAAKGAAKGDAKGAKGAAKGAATKGKDSGYQAPAAKAGGKPAAPKSAAAKAAAAKALATKSVPDTSAAKPPMTPAAKVAAAKVAAAKAKALANKTAPATAGAKPMTPAAKAAAAKALALSNKPSPASEEPAFKKFKGPEKGKGKGKDKGTSAGENKGKGAPPREMIHDDPLTGTVVTWRGKFGWIKPHDTIDHPLATRHKGDLYFCQDDVEDEIDGVGAEVQFMLYQDAKGLGATGVKPA